MLRSIGAVAAGFVTMVILVMIGSIAIAATTMPGGIAALKQVQQGGPAPTPTLQVYVMNIVMSLVAAFVGGWVALRLAGRAPVGHLAALAVVVLLMGLVSAFVPGSASQPTWYKLLIPLVGVAGVAASALLAPSMG